MNDKKLFWYFAYGSNMKQEQLESRVRRSNLFWRKGILNDHELCFNKEADDGSGYANIKKSVGKYVWGVLYRLSDEELKHLDNCYEGVPDHYLRDEDTQRLIKVNNNQLLAEVYIANPKKVNNCLKPRKCYLKLLLDGAKDHNLPEEYRAFLESFKTFD
jgi:gamma-glutamylcyclotransferase (GGCT)/AIG2-like uncharacterized protein YtfP